MVKDLDKKIALITGGAQGIGAACVKLLSEHGAIIVSADKDRHENKYADKCIEVDISSHESIMAMIHEVINTYEHIDILVNNAGIVDRCLIGELTVEKWDMVLNTNLRGTHLLCQSCCALMKEHGSGKVINISSLAGRTAGKRTSPAYVASKAGIIGLTKSYSLLYASNNIHVNSVAPGLIITQMTEGRNKPSAVPIGRLGTAEDIANAVYFLASPLSDYITGVTIDVNGGLYMT